MERELFTWDGWDGEPECMIFYNPRLKIDIDPFPMGTIFNSAAIVQNKVDKETGQTLDYGILEFHDADGNAVASFKLHIKVAERIS